MEKWDLLVYIPSFSLVEKYSDSLQFCITQSYNFKKNCTRNCHNEHYFMYIVIHICSYFEVLFYVALLCNEIYYSIIYKQWKYFWITLHTCMAFQLGYVELLQLFPYQTYLSSTWHRIFFLIRYHVVGLLQVWVLNWFYQSMLMSDA